MAMVVCFATLGGQLHIENLAIGQPKAKILIMSLPVLFTSFGYHPCIPSIVNYIGDDKKRSSVFLGWVVLFRLFATLHG